MEGREAKELTFIKGKIVNREQESIKLQGRKIYRGESQNPRVRNNLRARIFADLGYMLLFVEKNGYLFKAQKKCCKNNSAKKYKRCFARVSGMVYETCTRRKNHESHFVHMVCIYILFFSRRNVS